ncbi:hypothetical protein [Planomonospora sp. ID82291]|uniref:DUF6907 domain-containing protein n=1 Tax=Planomonospora sp. ID82291 TaxID=2738136 RepID=UPI0018C3BF8A|nr:hypothetical protein [Planomonospora sp. ID82291]MBG0818190.1 hypothetical protein [Planomonospora sp. ID82291]
MFNGSRLLAEAATLSADQLDGIACVRCGRDDTPMTPVGRVDGCQVFACASCATTPEPPAAVDLHALLDSLTPAQLNGRACITCGAAGEILKPIGKLLDRDVVECDAHKWERDGVENPPTWLTGPCPAWCIARHHAMDCPEDRQHSSEILGVDLTTHDFENCGTQDSPAFRPVSARVDLIQHYREAEARVCVGVGDDTSFRLTLAEAEQHARHLLRMVALARGQVSSPE